MRNNKFKGIVITLIFSLFAPYFTNASIFDFNSLLAEKENFQKRHEALEKSENIKGIYLTQYIGGSSSSWAVEKREKIKELLRESELNGVVIDVKEVGGTSFTNTLKEFIKELQQEDVWVIARIVVCRDSSLINSEPEWYLKDSSGNLWRDSAGYYWLDPACPEVHKYILNIAKKAAEFGFDEIQFDYLRFPNRGDLEDINYPCHNKEKKRETISQFYSVLSENLRSYKNDLILSIDLFGLVAQYLNIPSTGQNFSDTLTKFDYVSFMLYPSHFFNGFAVAKDPKRNLPALYFPGRSEDIEKVASNHPYEIISRTLFNASDYISSLKEKRTYQYTRNRPFCSLANYLFSEYKFFLEDSETRIRPWLQDFDLKTDSQRGIYYDSEKVRAQIEAAQDTNSAGWLLWSPISVYIKEALN